MRVADRRCYGPEPTSASVASHRRAGVRNDRLLDAWSIPHFLSGVALGWVMEPFWALVILVLWEPVEIFVLSPLAWRLAGKEFGFEAWRNSLSDILVDAAGVTIGAFAIGRWWTPPFYVG